MSRKADLEHRIQGSYKIITEYEVMLQYGRPEEKLHASQAIQQQWGLIYGYLKEYILLCKTRGWAISDNIAQFAARFPDLGIEGVELGPSSDVAPTTGDSITSLGNNIKNLINKHERRLQMLKEQQAIQGITTDPSIIIETEKIEATLEKLYIQLEQLTES